MAPESDSLRSLIGGRWAVSWQGYLLAWPLAVLFTFFAAPSIWNSETTAEGLIRGIVAGTLGYVPIGVVLWLASATVLRTRREEPVPVTLVALVGAAAWTMRSVTMITYMQMAGLPSEASPAVRLITGFAQGALATTLPAWLLATTYRFHERRTQLLNELAQQEVATDQLVESVQQMRTEVLDGVRRTVEATVSRMDGQMGREAPSSQTVDALATASQRVSRELARELLSDAARTARLNPLIVLRSAVVHRPYAYWGLLPSVVLGLAGLSIYWPLGAAATALTIVTAFALCVSSLANAVTPRLSPRPGMAVYGASVLLLLSSAIVMQVAMSRVGLDPSENHALGWSVAINFGVLYPLIGIGAHVGRACEDVLARLRRSITTAEVEREALRREKGRLHRDLAFSLHGSLQADLTASAMRAQHAIDKGDSATAAEALTHARLLIQDAADLPARSTSDLRDIIESVAQAWEGIVDITAMVRVTDEPDPTCVGMVKDVVIEGVGNAVRHGAAKAIQVEIDDADGGVRVTITDDGCGVGDAAAGLGSAMLDELAPNAWSLQPASTGGSTLTVTLRVKTTTVAN